MDTTSGDNSKWIIHMINRARQATHQLNKTTCYVTYMTYNGSTWMTEDGYKQVVHWIDKAITSTVLLKDELPGCKGFMLMDKYNWLLLNVKNRETTKEDVLTQKEINKVVDECRELGLITPQHCEANKSHYLKWENP